MSSGRRMADIFPFEPRELFMSEIEHSENLVAEATGEHRKALARLREHDALIEKTERAIAELDSTIDAALSKPDKGAGWRKSRSALTGELDGLNLQRGVLVKSVDAAEAGVRAAEWTLAGAREDDLTRRLAAAEAGLRPHVEAIVAVWLLYCERYKGYLCDSRASFSDWLLGGEYGLFDLGELMKGGRDDD